MTLGKALYWVPARWPWLGRNARTNNDYDNLTLCSDRKPTGVQRDTKQRGVGSIWRPVSSPALTRGGGRGGEWGRGGGGFPLTEGEASARSMCEGKMKPVSQAGHGERGAEQVENEVGWRGAPVLGGGV